MTGLLLLNLGIGFMVVCCVADKHIDAAPDKPAEIQMGVPNPDCDNGKSNIKLDYKPSVLRKVCRCMDDRNEKKRFKILEKLKRYKEKVKENPNKKSLQAKEECETKTQDPTHKCLNESITYKSSIPTSGDHRPLWPKFGEYMYLPPQRWMYSLEHGAIVFLYHPCADKAAVNQLRTIATSCLNKHIITPSSELRLSKYPFAVLSWGCRLLLPAIDEAKIKDFMIRKALNALETNQADEGQFEVGLIHSVGKQKYEIDGDTVCPSEPKSTSPTSVEESDIMPKPKCQDFMADTGVIGPNRSKNKGKAIMKNLLGKMKIKRKDKNKKGDENKKGKKQ